ncbi:MAG: response regulator transcription factor [Chloroflexales bacterium]|nr:response regulator transcription factor [Chloroflexales bacterium]
MIRVFIVASALALRAGLRAMATTPAIDIVGEAVALPGQAMDQAGVDVLLLGDDTQLADATRIFGGEGVPALVVLTDEDRVAATLRSLALPGWGIVSPEADSAELQATIGAVAQGLVVLPPVMAERLFNSPPTIEVEPIVEALTAREREVLDLISQGLSNKLIANRLQISEHTVKFHVSSIFTKLGATSRTEAVSLGARQGLITL